MKIVIAEYSDLWPQMFERERQQLAQILPDTCIIEHIGSTSVPGLAAKPIIDIMIGLADFAEADFLVASVCSLGYKYNPRFEDQMPYRRFFGKDILNVRTHHVHMVAISSEFWNRHLFFRDYLRTHSQVAAEYATLKRELAQCEWEDTNDYTDAKTSFIQSIEAKAQ